MLRSIILENFVGFKTKQCIKFPENESPSIFVGENGSGKSSLLEGIRRCLPSARSTTRSSSYDGNFSSYFVCQYDTSKCTEPDLSKKDTLMFTGILTMPDQTYYKFISTESELIIDKHKADSVFQLQSVDQSDAKNVFIKFKQLSSDRKENDHSTPETFIATNRCFSQIIASEESTLEQRLKLLENYVVMTFPLRSIGPLQWSKSDKIAADQRGNNYSQASQRAEIITYFLKNEKYEFDIDKEKAYFRGLTGHDIEFELAEDKKHITVKSTETNLPGDEYALLKTPEGILEAKHFSVLMSSKQFLTLILEEPDRGMHPQMINRMLSIIGKEKKNKKIVLTTHNPCFIRSTEISRLTVFKRIKTGDNGKDQTETLSGLKICMIAKPQSGMKRLRILTQDHLSDLIFAKRVLFCEGDSEFLFLTALKEHIMTPSKGILKVLKLIHEGATDKQLDAHTEKLQNSILSLQISTMKGWHNASLMQQVSNVLKLDHAFLFDKDVIIDKDGKLRSHAWMTGYESIQKRFTEAMEDKSWGEVRRDLRGMKIFVWRDGTIENMLISLLRNETKHRPLKSRRDDSEISWNEKSALIQQLEKQNVCLPIGKWKEKRPEYKEFSDTAAAKLFIDSRVKQENITECVEIFLKACDDQYDDLVQFVDFLGLGRLATPPIREPIPSTSHPSPMDLRTP